MNTCAITACKSVKEIPVAVITTAYKGDTIKIVTEKYGDSVVKHFTDLQGTTGGDGFDNSYSVTSIFSKRKLDSVISIKGKTISINYIITENYRTEFSHGKNLYFIAPSGDTVGYKHYPGGIR